jgi:hypothetical protein
MNTATAIAAAATTAATTTASPLLNQPGSSAALPYQIHWAYSGEVELAAIAMTFRMTPITAMRNVSAMVGIVKETMLALVVALMMMVVVSWRWYWWWRG